MRFSVVAPEPDVPSAQVGGEGGWLVRIGCHATCPDRRGFQLLQFTRGFYFMYSDGLNHVISPLNCCCFNNHTFRGFHTNWAGHGLSDKGVLDD